MNMPTFSSNGFLKLLCVLSVSIATFVFVQISYSAEKQQTFTSAEEAATAFVTALKSSDDNELLRIFGADGRKLVRSGDPVSDKENRDNFLRLYSEKNVLIQSDDRMILHIGPDSYPFPIPLVKKGAAWYFDTNQGKDEILNRQIGRNELETIQTMLAIVDAQREYVSMDHDGDGLLTYAGKFASDKGKKNGLYWETREGEKPSPLGDLVARARNEGYMKGKPAKPFPYHGYYFKILTKQGENAAGGAFDYLVKGRMIGGFAVVAYPAAYGRSGVMTFMVNHDGTVFQKDLGVNTLKIAKSMKSFDPGSGWKPAVPSP